MDNDLADAQHGAPLPQLLRRSGSYAFLNHSSLTVPNNLPPNVDDKLLARHKRKRTSPEDQAILEAAYYRDPKPDKAARLELVNRVALGEKEVQIWFQNRRQTSRRRSRPLLPHEIVQYQLSRSVSCFQGLPLDFMQQDEYDDRISKSSQCTMDPNSAIWVENREKKVETGAGTSDDVRSDEEASSSLPTASQNSTVTSQCFASSSPKVALATPSIRSVGPFRDLASRRSAPSLRVHRSADGSTYAPQRTLNTGSDCHLKHSSSVVRLSLSYEGKAQITTKNGTSPSPPRASQVLQVPANKMTTSVQQETNAVNHTNSVPPFKTLQKPSSGRSRDSRAWEFWCDKDARNELEEKAEKDASGSAADAIDLLRSASGRKVLGTLPVMRNSILSRQSSSLKRSRLDGKPSLLKRSSTSLGRLQSKPFDSGNAVPKLAGRTKDSGSTPSVYIPGNDSDKENWSPESIDQSEGSTVDGSSPADRHLSDNMTSQSYQDRSGIFASRPGKLLAGCENNDPEADPELAAFMRSGRKSNSISEEEEFDCVQNLLSLSQGNWR